MLIEGLGIWSPLPCTINILGWQYFYPNPRIVLIHNKTKNKEGNIDGEKSNK